MTFSDYVANGWVLVPLRPGTKAPDAKGWSDRRCCISSEAAAAGLQSAGLAHAYSGTCSIDVDEIEGASRWLGAQGVNLKDLLEAPDAVRITSGREGRAKLLYRLDEPLTTIFPCPGLELRCASRSGTTVQDVLPPSLHPETGEPYQWLYNDELLADWRTLPALPTALRRVWESALVREPVAEGVDAPVAGGEDPDELRGLLNGLDPDTGYDEWIRVGMALHHATGGSAEGLEVWDDWSASGEKYRGRSDLVSHWRSFDNGSDGLVTSDWLRSRQVAEADAFDPVEAFDPWEAATEKEDELAEQFEFVAAGEWADRPPPPWLVKDVLPQADLAMIYGESSSGKSFFALDMAFAIASGSMWRGEHLTAQGNVAWIAAEAAGSMRDRLRAAAQGYGFSLDHLPLYITGETPNLGDVSNVRALASAAQSVEPALVVVDTLAAASGGANENSGEDMSAILAACRVLHKATGALVLLIHHSGKDKAKGARGWSGLRAAMQTEIELTYDPARVVRGARVAKQRDGKDGIQMPFRLASVTVGAFEDGEERESCYVEPVEPRPPDDEPAEKVTAGAMESAVRASIAPGAGETPVADVLTGAVLQFDETPEGSRDFRTAQADRAMTGMIDRDVLQQVDGGLLLNEDLTL